MQLIRTNTQSTYSLSLPSTHCYRYLYCAVILEDECDSIRYFFHNMASRRGRLNWSNLEIRISDEVIEKQHQFTLPNSLSSPENIIEEEKESIPTPPPPSKRSWMPKVGVGDMQAEQFIGNYMLTSKTPKIILHTYWKCFMFRC